MIAFVFLIFSCSQKKEQSEKKKKGPVEIEAIVLKSNELSNIITTSGTVLAGEMVELKSETAGRIVRLNISEGRHATKGTILVQVDDSELQARLRRLTAQLKLAVENEKRKKELLTVNGIAQVEYDAAYTELETTKADIDLLNAQIRKCTIIAPFDGTLGLRTVSEGAYLSVGTVVSVLVQTDPVKIEFSIPEKYAGFIKNTAQIRFTIVGSDKKYSAQIYASQSEIDQESRALKIRAITKNPNHELIPGAFANIELQLENPENAILVPSQCLVPLMNSQNLMVCRGKNIKMIKVETGIRTEDQVQILSGVSVGDTVAVTGLLALKDKMPVIVKKIIDN